MPTNAATLRAYTARGLALIRLSNRLDADAQAELARLAAEIRRLLGSVSVAEAGRREAASLAGELEARIIARFGEIGAAQAIALRELVGVEAAFARRVADYAREPSRAALARAAAAMLFLGATPEQHWSHAGQQIGFRVASAWRNAVATGGDDAALRALVLGTGHDNRGGILERARREASRLTDAGVIGASRIGRGEAMRANGVDAVMWHAILDGKQCADCGMRAGLLYTLDGDPIGHDVPLVAEPPFHHGCRCMLVPQQYPGDPPTESEGRFESYLESLTDAEQDEQLGVGRAQLWRDGKITLRDLIGQSGRVLTLGDLRALGP